MKRLVFTGLMLGVAACSVDLAPLQNPPDAGSGGGVGDGGGTGGSGGFVFDAGGNDSGGSAGADSCTDCMLTSCAASDAACGTSSECIALNDCLADCPTPKCQAACMQSHPEGFPLLFASLSCLEKRCALECGWDAQCYSCEATQCAGTKQACIEDYDCIAHWYCTALCISKDCFDQCDAAFPKGAQKSEAYASCSQQLCAEDCF